MEEYGQLILYKNKEVKLYQDTVWLNQKQLVELFDSSKSNILSVARVSPKLSKKGRQKNN